MVHMIDITEMIPIGLKAVPRTVANTQFQRVDLLPLPDVPYLFQLYLKRLSECSTGCDRSETALLLQRLGKTCKASSKLSTPKGAHGDSLVKSGYLPLRSEVTVRNKVSYSDFLAAQPEAQISSCGQKQTATTSSL